MCCPKSPLLADGDTEFDLRVRGLLLRLAGEGKTGICPRTPFIVSRTCKPKPAGRAHGDWLGNPCTRAPFRLLSIRAPRQAELRTSSWLAPSSTTRPCDRPAEKTRDATDRCLPPKRNYVYPHLARSQLTVATFVARTPHGVLGSVT